MNPFREPGPYTEMCRKRKTRTIYYNTDATDSVGEEREEIQTREQPPRESTSDKRPHDTNSIYIKCAEVGAKGRKKPKTQRPRPNRPPETPRTTEQTNADPAQETQTQRNSNDDGNNNDEFRRRSRELNLSRPTRHRYATRSNTDTIRMIAYQCRTCQVAFKYRTDLRTHRREQHEKDRGSEATNNRQ